MTDDDLIVAILSAADELTDERFRTDFFADFMARRAAERIIEIVGDMVGRFSSEFQAAHPEIEYRDAKATRNHLAHQYLDVDAELLWGVVHHEIPRLAAQLNAISATG